MNQKFNIVEPTKMTLLTALICVSTYIVIPFPFTSASLTAQILVVNLVALLLTPRQATSTMVVYILLGLTGLPVFFGTMGSPGKLFGPTGGYVIPWIPAVILMSRLKGTCYSFKRYYLVIILVGMPIIYLVGSAYMKFIAGIDWAATFTVAVIPSIPLDIFKYFAAVLTTKSVQISLSGAQQTR